MRSLGVLGFRGLELLSVGLWVYGGGVWDLGLLRTVVSIQSVMINKEDCEGLGSRVVYSGFIVVNVLLCLLVGVSILYFLRWFGFRVVFVIWGLKLGTVWR